MGVAPVFDLTMLDSATGEVLFQKKSFFEPTIQFFFGGDGHTTTRSCGGARSRREHRRTLHAWSCGLRFERQGGVAYGTDKPAEVVGSKRWYKVQGSAFGGRHGAR